MDYRAPRDLLHSHIRVTYDVSLATDVNNYHHPESSKHLLVHCYKYSISFPLGAETFFAGSDRVPIYRVSKRTKTFHFVLFLHM